MMAALDRASAMLDAYDITDADVQVTRDEKVALHADPQDVKDPHLLKWRLSTACERSAASRFIGSPASEATGLSDCRATWSSRWLLDTLADFVFGALYAHLIGCLAPKNERRTIIRSLWSSCCDRINDRLIELVERSKEARTSNGRELVVVKDAAIKAFMKDNGIRLARSAAAARER